jgi:hypothetical protein
MLKSMWDSNQISKICRMELKEALRVKEEQKALLDKIEKP